MYRSVYMKIMIRTLVVSFLALILCSAACNSKNQNGQNQTKELTDEEVVVILNQDSKFTFTTDGLCFERPSSFKGLVLIGFFAHDRGCDGDVCVYNGKKENTNVITEQLFSDNGWSDDTKREDLILKWAQEVATVWSTFLATKPEKFGDGFSEPAIHLQDNSYVLTYWLRQQSGMLPEDNYDKIQITFSSKGKIENLKKIDSKTVGMHDDYDEIIED